MGSEQGVVIGLCWAYCNPCEWIGPDLEQADALASLRAHEASDEHKAVVNGDGAEAKRGEANG